MEQSNSITEFFYNIVPGSIFVIAFNHYLHPPIFDFLENSMDAGVIFFLLISGLFFGFVFHGFTKFIRSCLWLDLTVFNKVINEDNKSFAIASGELAARGLIGKNDPKKQAFYKMDNYLRAKGYAKTIQHFTARLAFWSNIFFGTVIVCIVVLSLKNYSDLPWLLLLLIFSGWLFYEYLRILYDSVLKTFVTVLLLKNKKPSW